VRPTTHVLLLYQQQAEASSMLDFAGRLRESLRADLKTPVDFYQESLDLDRFSGRDRWTPLARYVTEKYRGFRVDVIVAVGAVALQFANDRLSDTFSDVPVVFALGVEPLISIAELPPSVTGRIAAPTRFTPTLAMARRLQPDAQRVVVIGGLATTDSASVLAAVSAVRVLNDSLKLVVLQGLSLDELVRRLRRLPPRSIVLLANYRRDERGLVFNPVDIVGILAQASSAPIYGQLRDYVGQGVLGGGVISFADEGSRTGHLIARVLRRRPGETMPPVETIGRSFVVDWRALRRWHLDEALLPPGTEVLFREHGMWERYRGQIVVTLSVIAAQFILIGLLLLERRRRKSAQRAIAEQVAYEQTIAELTTDAVRHAPDDSPRALEDALARIARYAGASTAILVQYPDIPLRAPTRLFWTSPAEKVIGNGSPAAAPSTTAASNGVLRLEIPLVADGASIGSLELYRHRESGDWPARLVGRLDAAAELIAGAMARARAARTIRRGEELNRAVLASLSTQIAILDRNGTIIRVNEAWRALARATGVDPAWDAFLGANYLEECHRAEQRGCEYARDIRRGIEAVLEREAWPFRFEYHWTSPDERWYELFVERLEHVDGRAIVTHVDITNRRLAERRAEETRRQVAHMGRVALIGELAATMSHELRQPLSAIRANAEAGALLLAKSPDDVATAQQIFKDIVDDDVRAAEVIDQVRALLRKDDPPMSHIDVNPICQHAARLLHGDARLRHTRLDLSLQPGLPLVFGDPVQLQQVVLNLTINALDAASASPDESRSVTITTQSDKSSVEIAIRDTGGGLAPDVKQHLFESFFSTKTRGLGLGLVIVRSIVDRHNGRIVAENHSLGGAVFRVVLPASATPLGGARPSISLLDCHGEVQPLL
jgi:signal transduction histidine kinase/ABC-type uncharacterized transport system substrate-binding protein